jgi:hypothetical protein
MKRVLLAMSVVFASGPLLAGALEVAPFYGLRFGGTFKNEATGDSLGVDESAVVGGTVNIALRNPREKLELLYSHQETQFEGAGATRRQVNLNVDVWQVGLLREYVYDDEQFRPFLVGTLGVTNFGFSGVSQDEDLFSMGLGGGFKYFPTPRIGFRLDLRAYVSFVEGGGGVACSGGCVATYSGSVFVQGEITPSVVISF